ncbi:MAG: hypothetical protein WCQ41_05140 [Bacillota bacterium]
MATKYCESCGSAYDSNSSFCTNCGKANINYNASAPSQNPTYQPAPPQFQQAPYQATPPQPGPTYPGYYPGPDLNAPLSVGQYVGMFLINAIPLVGFIVLLVWAFSGSTNTNKKNFARANLIILLIVLVIYIAIILITVFILAKSASNYNNYYRY